MKKAELKKLTTAAQVVEALGGPQAVAELTGSGIKTVWNWHGYFNRFPASMHDCMTGALEALGYTAPPALWKQHSKKKRVA